MNSRDNILILFDIDGTLTDPRKSIDPEMHKFILNEIKPRSNIGIITGANIEKIFEQLNGRSVLQEFDYVFPENGMIQYRKGVETGRASILKHFGEKKLQMFINFVLKYLSELQLPFKRGTFIEYRAGMFNICPVGTSCNLEERKAFIEYEKKHQIRAKFIKTLEKTFPDLGMSYGIGGQISFDAFPTGWDKTFCLQFVTEFPVIYFFGDKTDAGGNDHEIYNHHLTIGHKVTSPKDTKEQLQDLFGIM